MYNRLHGGKSLLRLKPQHLVPLLGGNYPFFIYPARDILLPFFRCHIFSPGVVYLRLFILLCNAFLSLPSLFKEDEVDLPEVFSSKGQLAVG